VTIFQGMLWGRVSSFSACLLFTFLIFGEVLTEIVNKKQLVKEVFQDETSGDECKNLGKSLECTLLDLECNLHIFTTRFIANRTDNQLICTRDSASLTISMYRWLWRHRSDVQTILFSYHFTRDFRIVSMYQNPWIIRHNMQRNSLNINFTPIPVFCYLVISKELGI